MNLVYKDLSIRLASKEDAELLFDWWSNGAIMAHAGFPEGLHTTVEEIANSFDIVKSIRLILEENGIPIGEANYSLKSPEEARIGIKICEQKKQNGGRGKQYLSLLITYLFNDLKVKKIILDTNLNNKRAQAVYEKLGFIKVGIRKDAWKDQIGRLQSIVDYELTKEDFNSFI